MRKVRPWHLAFIGFFSAATGFIASRATAGGAPASAALTYSGVLDNADGVPLKGGSHAIVVSLWDDARASQGAKKCEAPSPTGGYDLGETGHFSVALPGECATQVKADPNLWVQLTVDGTVLPRTKLGAVPYALEADHAVAADRAATVRGMITTGAFILVTGTGATIANQQTQWLTSVARTATGSVTLNMPPTVFGQHAPDCIVTTNGLSGTAVLPDVGGAKIVVNTLNTAGAPMDVPFMIMCIGEPANPT